jgi:flagellar basal-body rod protein FlgF
MHEGIYIAASAGIKQGKKMEVIAQNLANVNSTGYKRDRLTFKELMTPFPPDNESESTNNTLLQPDKSNSNVSYVAVTDQYTDHEPGKFKQTNSELDMALDGSGYFSVSTKDGIRYTRNGNFRLDTENRIVNQKGQPVLNEQGEPIVITGEGTEISIDAYGNIFVGSGERSANIGKIKFVDFDNKQTLEKLGDGLFYQSDTEADEKPVNNTKLRQGFLEGSNVAATDEMANMISTLRLFETYQKMIQSIDNMDDQSVNSIGRIG